MKIISKKDIFILCVLFILMIVSISLSILGGIERTGYMSNFELQNEEDGVYTYGMRIRYYDSIFGNSDIYGVYISNEQFSFDSTDENSFISVDWERGGSPFGSIESAKEFSSDDKIDVLYTLKFKHSLFIILLMIFYMTYIVLSYIIGNYIAVKNMVNSSTFTNIIVLAGLLFTIGFVFFAPLSRMSWDSINYIANGVSLFNTKSSLISYPGTLFSILTVFPTMFLFGNTQLSHLVYINLIPIILTVVFTYKIIRLFTEKYVSLLLVMFIFLLSQALNFSKRVTTVTDMLGQPYADGWLLMFLIIAGYFILKEKLVYAAILVAIAHFFRSSMAVPLGIFLPILIINASYTGENIYIKKLPNIIKRFYKYILYFIILFLSIFLIQTILNTIFTLNSETTFYSNIVSVDTSIAIKKYIEVLFEVYKSFYDSTFLLSVLSVIAILCIVKSKNNALKRLTILGVLYFLICFAGAYKLWIEIGDYGAKGNNRYFIYAVLFLSIPTYLFLYEYICTNRNVYKKIFLLIFLLIFAYSTSHSIKDLDYSISSITSSDYSTDYPKIEDDKKILMVEFYPQGTLNYIFKNQSWQDGHGKNNSFFYTNDNSDYEYIFSERKFLNNKETIIDDSGLVYNRIWQSSTPSKFTLFERVYDTNYILK